MSRRQVVVVAVVLVALVALVAVEPSFAQAPAADPPTSGGASSSEAGQKLAEMLKGWGTALLFGVAVLVGLPALAKREIGQSVVILVIVLVIGGFAFAEPTIKTLIREIWDTLSV